MNVVTAAVLEYLQKDGDNEGNSLLDSEIMLEVYMNLFIDTNVFLTSYHLTSDELKSFHAVVLIRKKKIQLSP